MYFLPVGRRGGAIDRRAHEWVPESDTRADVDQARSLGWPDRVGSDPESLDRAPQQRHVSDRLGGRSEQELLRTTWE